VHQHLEAYFLDYFAKNFFFKNLFPKQVTAYNKHVLLVHLLVPPKANEYTFKCSSVIFDLVWYINRILILDFNKEKFKKKEPANKKKYK
jgi:hypothetical protein